MYIYKISQTNHKEAEDGDKDGDRGMHGARKCRVESNGRDSRRVLAAGAVADVQIKQRHIDRLADARRTDCRRHRRRSTATIEQPSRCALQHKDKRRRATHRRDRGEAGWFAPHNNGCRFVFVGVIFPDKDASYRFHRLSKRSSRLLS